MLLLLRLIVFCIYIISVPAISLQNSLHSQLPNTKSESYIEKLEPYSDDVSAEELLKILPNDRFIGNKNAPIIMIEYASLSCIHCADFSLKVLPEIEKKYINTGKALFIFRNFPLDYKSLKATMLGFCYDNVYDYFNYNKAVFYSIEDFVSSGKDLGILNNIAKITNIGHLYNKCINDERVMDYIVKEKLIAIKKLNVRATPAFFINGNRYEGGYDKESFFREFDKIIKEKPNYSVVKEE